MKTSELDINPDSDALQYDIVDENGVWYLRRSNPSFPLTPDEAYFVAEAKTLLPNQHSGVDTSGRPYHLMTAPSK